MERDWVGWTPTLTSQEIYERNRGVWYLSARAERERYTVFSSTVAGVIVAVVANEGIENIDGRRKAIIGKVLELATRFTTRWPVSPCLIGTAIQSRTLTTPSTSERALVVAVALLPAAGCSLPGHDQRAVHERIARQWGDTLRFIQWFDNEYGARQ